MKSKGIIPKNLFSFPDTKKMIITFLLILAGFFHQTYGQETTKSAGVENQEKAPVIFIPEFSEIIPLASEIEVKLARTQKILNDTINEDALVSSFKTIKEELDTLELALIKIKSSGWAGFNELKSLKIELRTVAQNFTDANIPLSKEIAKIENQRKIWLEEEENWSLWKDTLVTKNPPNQIKSIFRKTQKNIDMALSSLVPKLDKLLGIQENGYKIQPKIDILLDEIDSIEEIEKEQVLLDESAPIFSSKYRDQFTQELWDKSKTGYVKMLSRSHSYPNPKFWELILGILLFLLVFLTMKKFNEAIENNIRYKFLSNKALSSALFISLTTVFILFKYENLSPAHELLISVIIGITFCYILKDRLTSWKKEAVYFFAVLVLLNNFLFAIDFPIPFFRLYITLSSFLLIFLAVRWIKISKAENDHKYWIFLLYSGAVFFSIAFLAEIIGKEALAMFLFDAFIRTVIIIVLFVVYIFVIRGGLEWLLLNFNAKQNHLSPEDISKSVARLTTFINILAVVFIILPELLVIWGVYSNLQEADEGLMAMGFKIGDSEITLQLILIAICVLYGSYIISSLFSRFIMNETMDNDKFDKGTRLSIAQLFHYFIIFVGFVVAISVLGFDLTNFTIALSALGVGIGFGLQGLVNNFVSGLVLLFERPIREGDSIEAPGVPWSTVKEIGLRSTRLITYEKGDLIVPNSELILKNVTNWTLTNKIRKVILPISVVYGSDIALVFKTLKEAGKASDELVKNSEPTVLLRKFDESSLNFELRVLAKDATSGLSLQSTLLADIAERFKKANIEFAFPQMDVHLFEMNQDRQKERFKPKTTDN
ncbi:MAG: mechanosensitive ion channel domain-containing protein [Eudoraea sp.]|uniref:mechanosensitive ion channel family protein n=1 Tax=Eudoraea sp. TaxID=1979955 RepID=UPI0032634FF5